MRFVLLVVLLVFSKAFSITIYTTVKPLADIVREATGEEVYYLIPPSMSIHNYEFKPSQLIKVYKSSLFLYIGSGEPDLKGIIESLPKEKKVKIIDIPGLTLIENDKEEVHENHSHAVHPALWLNPENAKKIASYIANILIEKNPGKRKIYQTNLNNFLKKIDRIKKYGLEKFSKLRNKNFISYHYTWPYFTDYFGLNYIGVIEMGHGREPTPKHLLRIINIINENKIKTIFAAVQFYNKKYINIIQKYTKVRVVFLDPFGIDKASYYLMLKTIIDKIYDGLYQ